MDNENQKFNDLCDRYCEIRYKIEELQYELEEIDRQIREMEDSEKSS